MLRLWSRGRARPISLRSPGYESGDMSQYIAIPQSSPFFSRLEADRAAIIATPDCEVPASSAS